MNLKFVLDINGVTASFDSISDAITAANGALLALGISPGQNVTEAASEVSGTMVFMSTVTGADGNPVTADTGVTIRPMLV